MSVGRLLHYFDQTSEAPDAVPRLRRFILDLAVRGKLVEQVPVDEPAWELLKRIEAEKVRLIQEGNARRQRALSPIGDDEIPFRLPVTWRWTRLADLLTKLTDGTHHSPPNFETGDFKYVTAKNIKPEGVSLDEITYVSKDVHAEMFARCDPAKGDILYIKDGATTGIVTINDLDEPFSMLSSVALLRLSHAVYNRLLVYFLRSPFFYSQMRGFMKGAAITRVTLTRMAPALIPLPPLAEQHRIVAKVDELMALCDELEAAQAKRERRRDRLVAATLHGLNNGDASAEPNARSAFEDSARFYFNHLPRLTTRPEHIHQLRQTILNLAVRGKLVPQHPKDEPLEGVDLIALSEDEAPFDIPENWRWTRFGHLGQMQGGGTPSKSRPEYWDGDIPWVSPKDMKRDYIDASILHISSKAVAESSVKLIQEGSVLFVVRGMILAHSFPVALATIPVTVNQDMKALTLFLPEMGEFVLRVLKGLRESILSKVLRSSHGTCRLDSSDYLALPFPLPPLAEQHRVVAKVDELMALCDETEAGLITAATACRQLLEATLAEALST